MQKLRRINKEKDFWNVLKKEKTWKINCRKRQIAPLSQLCGPVCGFCREGKKTPPRSHTSPCWAIFAGRLERQDFFEPVWVSQASETEISYTNSQHLTSSMAYPKEWLSQKNLGDTWGRK